MLELPSSSEWILIVGPQLSPVVLKVEFVSINRNTPAGLGSGWYGRIFGRLILKRL